MRFPTLLPEFLGFGPPVIIENPRIIPPTRASFRSITSNSIIIGEKSQGSIIELKRISQIKDLKTQANYYGSLV